MVRNGKKFYMCDKFGWNVVTETQHPENDRQEETARTGQPGWNASMRQPWRDGRDIIYRAGPALMGWPGPGQPWRDGQDKISRTGQPGLTDRTWQIRRDCLDRTARTKKAGQDWLVKKRTARKRQPGQNSQDKVAGTRLSVQGSVVHPDPAGIRNYLQVRIRIRH
jgi:hypothetical protein